jgi:hypothetical protein
VAVVVVQLSCNRSIFAVSFIANLEQPSVLSIPNRIEVRVNLSQRRLYFVWVSIDQRDSQEVPIIFLAVLSGGTWKKRVEAPLVID